MAKKETSARNDQDRLRIEQNHDVETVSANTDESLLNTRSNSESNSISKGSSADSSCYDEKNSRRKCGFYCSLVSGFILGTLGILFLIWTPFELLMEQRLLMIPGLPAFDWWLHPPDEVLLKVFVFNVTNEEAFMAGIDDKMHISEVGPIVYLEKLTYSNVTFNANDTLSYTSKRSAIYLPNLNTIDLNASIVVPNYALIGVAAYLHDASFVTKFGFNMLLRSLKSTPFVKTTVYNFLWNQSDPILEVAHQFAPKSVNSLNIGILDVLYSNFEDTATVYIGMKHGHKQFFQLDKFDGSEYLPGHGSECMERVTNSTEGSAYPQYITKNMTLRYWRKSLCRVIPLYYEKEKYLEKYDLLTYKFTKPSNAYDRKSDLTEDCHKGNPTLPSGLSDLSLCYHALPMAASFPHFLYGGDLITAYVSGLTPNVSLHESYVFVEPTTGIPVEAAAKSQSNMIVPDLSGFGCNLHKFNNIVIPMFWLEYMQTGLPDYITHMMRFTVNILPTFQYWLIALLLTISVALLVVCFRSLLNSRRNSKHFKQKSDLQFEEEAFLKKSAV